MLLDSRQWGIQCNTNLNEWHGGSPKAEDGEEDNDKCGGDYNMSLLITELQVKRQGISYSSPQAWNQAFTIAITNK